MASTPRSPLSRNWSGRRTRNLNVQETAADSSRKAFGASSSGHLPINRFFHYRKIAIPGKIRLSEKSATTNDRSDCTNKRVDSKGPAVNGIAPGSSLTGAQPNANGLSSFFVEESGSLSPAENEQRKEFAEWCHREGGKPTQKGFETWKASQAEKNKGYVLNGKFFTRKKANELAKKDPNLALKFKPAIFRGNKVELIAKQS
jgi:hypothetical protein